VTGFVDSADRALLPIRLRNPQTLVENQFDAWVDTGFTGELVVPQTHIAALGLPLGPAIRAKLADGSEVQLDTYLCQLDWFGNWIQIEVIANAGTFPLLGTGLMRGRDLHVDYSKRTVTLL
jgi:clan AA aspartic protease